MFIITQCLCIRILSTCCLVSYKVLQCCYHSVDTQQGPVGFLGTKTFCVPHFFDYRKQPSFSLHDLPWVPINKQLLIRERRGCETREKQTVKSSLGARSCFPINNTHNNIFELFCRCWHALQVGEVKMVCCPQTCRPQTSWTWRLMMLTPTYLTTNPSEECKTVTALILIAYPWPQAPTIRPLPIPQGGGHSYWGASLLCFPFAWQSNKAILFYFTQNCLWDSIRHWCTEKLSFWHQCQLDYIDFWKSRSSLKITTLLFWLLVDWGGPYSFAHWNSQLLEVTGTSWPHCSSIGSFTLWISSSRRAQNFMRTHPMRSCPPRIIYLYIYSKSTHLRSEVHLQILSVTWYNIVMW